MFLLYLLRLLITETNCPNLNATMKIIRQIAPILKETVSKLSCRKELEWPVDCVAYGVLRSLGASCPQLVSTALVFSDFELTSHCSKFHEKDWYLRNLGHISLTLTKVEQEDWPSTSL